MWEPTYCNSARTDSKILAFIDPPQGEVIEKILRHCGLRHCGLWHASAPRAPPDVDGLVQDLDCCSSESQSACSDQTPELTCVDIDTFLGTF